MDAITKFSVSHRPLIHRIDYYNRSFFSKPISSFSFPSIPSPSSRKFTITLTSATPKPQLTTQTLNPFPSSLLKATVLAAATSIATTALLFARFNLKPAIAAPILPPSSASEENLSEDESLLEKEKSLQAYADENPNDVQALKYLMEAKVKNQKIDEAITIVNRLIELEPEEEEWPLLKAHMHFKNDQAEIALKGFSEIASKDPLRSEAYHGLVMVASQLESEKEMKSIEERILEAIEICERDEKKKEARNLRLLIAQIRVIEGDFDGSLKIYKELVEDEPRDFRPYLCQGIIYTLLRKKDEAEEQFQKYRKFVPEEHPFVDYFDENMMATKLFAQKVENEERSQQNV
ncbi:protein SLOW GREEN 1, chloroplastic-like [Impatiens glandulifera]|uniref:protein SLOW GREEN 1, chloroplastic-like n=1 Tax=Impatiens glandulifera TaxID=253017 RepID=UPI001FB083B3|nr:protein SLOW GREEN 1, chloroplastic-like [Impatiens glandulifera]